MPHTGGALVEKMAACGGGVRPGSSPMLSRRYKSRCRGRLLLGAAASRVPAACHARSKRDTTRAADPPAVAGTLRRRYASVEAGKLQRRRLKRK